jgi:hypothetical protein
MGFGAVHTITYNTIIQLSRERRGIVGDIDTCILFPIFVVLLVTLDAT